MTAHAARGGLLASVLAHAEAFLLEPLDPASERAAPSDIGDRPVVAVFALARRCGATTVARGLAAELAVRDRGAAAVSSSLPAAGIPLASTAAARLARALADIPRARARPVGRLCLVEGPDPPALVDAARPLAPLVFDACGEPVGGAAAAVADHVVLVASPSVEPALAEVAARCVARCAPEPLLVLNRALAAGRWSAQPTLELPDSRMGAQLALAGREPRGSFGRAIAELADRCEKPS